MNKIAYYEELIMEKIATRAWKKHYGELSEVSQKKLIDSGIHNYKKELKGLEKGTKEILKKNNIKVRQNPISRAVGRLDVIKDFKKNPEGFDIGAVKKALKKEVHEGPAFSTIHLNSDGGNVFYNRNIPSRFVRVSKKIDNNISRAHGVKVDYGVSTKGLSRFEKKYISAITKRHEADEIRAGRDKNNVVIDSAIGKIRKYSTIGGHMSPDVLTREGSHVSIAPKGAKDFMTKIRTQTGEKGIWNMYGIDYGKDAIIDKRKAAAMKKEVGRVNSGHIF